MLGERNASMQCNVVMLIFVIVWKSWEKCFIKLNDFALAHFMENFIM